MTKFVHIDVPVQHHGIARIEEAASHLKQTVARFDGTRGATSLLLAALVAALLVVANQVMDTWNDGHMLAGWMVMWVIAFAGMALLAAPVRSAVLGLRAAVKAWSDAHRRAAEDERTWNAALRDARIMADLSRAMNGIAVDDLRRYR